VVPPAPSARVDGGAAPAAEAKEPPAAPPPLPEGTTVLHIGDSFAGALGIDLNKELKTRGVRGVLKYLTASYIPTWASSKDLTKYLWQYKPDLVLITLGANELEVPDPEIRAETIQRLVKRLDGRPCVWIAPPLWEGARGVLIPVIERNSKPCVFLSNAEIAADMPRARDKIHPSMNARRQWAKYVIDWLARHRVPNADRPWEMRGDD
jgi:lysophospholipase L1-like esterase